MGARPVTERQQAILDFILETIRTKGFPPTLREIGLAFGIRSTKGVNDHLDALEKKGKIRRHAELSRGIEVVEPPVAVDDVHSVPLVGRIAAGAPLLAEENIDQRVVLDRAWTGKDEVFLLRVEGESMVEAHICDGDLILVRRQDTAEDGDIVAALVDEEATVKRFFRERGKIRLQPENSSLQPLWVDPEETPFRVLGKVTSVFRLL